MNTQNMNEPILSAHDIAIYVSGEGPPLAMLHGFTQTASSWSPVIRHMQKTHKCIAVDMPGHGQSPVPQRSLPECARDIAHTVGRATYVGYSFGARVALHIALLYPEAVERLVLVSATAGIEDDAQRAERRHDDEMLAEYIHEVGINRFINEWLEQPLFAGLPPEFARAEERKQNFPEDLADSLRFAGTGTQEPLWEQLPNITVPVLLVAGKQDTKFVALAERMDSLLPNSTLTIFDDVGHTVHLEDVHGFCTHLEKWLSA